MQKLKVSLKAARVNAGYSLCTLAKALHVSKSTVSRWENGYIPIPKNKLLKICELCNANVDDIKI